MTRLLPHQTRLPQQDRVPHLRRLHRLRWAERPETQISDPEQGFALIACIVAIFILLLVLAVAAPKISRDLQRDRELESLHRGNEYVRAIQLYYRKFGRYPTSVAQLEKTNNIRFLRKKYDDPLTGKPDWRLIFVGQNKTTVKGLFGKPLAGLPTSGIGGAGLGGAATVGGSNGGNTSGSFGSSSTFGTSSATPGSGASTFGGTQTTGSSPSGSTGIGTQSATSFQGAGGPIMGVGSSKTGDSIVVLNEQTDYGTWEFLYDPRIEQLRAKSNLFGGGVGGSGASSTGIGSPSTGNGSLNDFRNPTGSTPTPTNPTSPAPPR